MDQYIGKLLDNRYEILELVGTGGMAKVYKARCHRLNRLVAIKILREDLSQDAEFRRRFHDESQAVAMLSHPNIVAVYDVSRSSELEYIVMELIDGITLKQYMQRKGNKLNWREALHFITQITKALGHAHSRGIIHRDIKPHNIMVLRDGSVKVADFGIARVASGGHSTLTQEALGSVHYISPEQARGSHIDSRSDLYSAGVVLYEMITGRLPFEGDTPVSVAIQHINSIPLSPRELDDSIPEALEAITMKAMAPNPDNRYLSADEMLAMCGANGAIRRVIVSKASRLVDFREVSSLTAIMKAAMEVLKEKFSISSVIFLMSLCTAFFSSLLISFSAERSAFSKSPQSFLRKRFTPSIPLVSQGFDCSTGPRNISYRRSVSAP